MTTCMYTRMKVFKNMSNRGAYWESLRLILIIALLEKLCFILKLIFKQASQRFHLRINLFSLGR